MEAKILSQQSNVAVVQLPGRSYPGIVIQGDSLNSLLQLAREAKNQLDASNAGEARDVLEEIIGFLSVRLLIYKSTLSGAGIDLPYHEG